MIIKEKHKKASDKVSMDKISKIINGLITDKKYRDGLYVCMGVSTGQRVSDLLDWKWEFVLDGDKFKREFDILEQKTSKIKGRKTRHIIFNDTLIKVMSMYWMSIDSPKEGYIFNNSNGCRLTERNMNYVLVESNWKYLKSERVSSISNHSLRKTFAWNYYERSGKTDESLHTLQRVLGHSSMSITLVYLGLMEKQMNDTYDVNIDINF